MGAILNGLALSKVRPYGAGFLIFSDYMKPPMRLAALMQLPVIYIFTHDSIGVGEDRPTHQPVEQLVALRSIPGLITLRPADANEVVEAWRVIIGLQNQPACLALSRQALPTLDRARYAPAAGLARGAYVLADAPEGKPEVIRAPAAKSLFALRPLRSSRGKASWHALLACPRGSCSSSRTKGIATMSSRQTSAHVSRSKWAR